MGQSLPVLVLHTFLILLIGGCDNPASSPQATRGNKRPTVASLVPAATDLILAMGLREQLVAVSNWDAPRPELDNLPRVGDYRTTDWEKLARLKPDVMVVQFAPGKMPPGMEERAREQLIKLVNVRINTLDDINQTITALGGELNASQSANDLWAEMCRKLNTIRDRTKATKPVPVLLARGATTLAAVGGGNFLDELLTLSGGRNVLGQGDNSYPTLDSEKLLQLNPSVIIVLLPGESAQVVGQARQFWTSMSELSAVRSGRVHILTDPWLLLPGASVTRTAERFHELLHPSGGESR